MSDLLDVRGLQVRIGDAHIVQGLDLSVAEGGVTAVLGRNGAGKTTTVRGILGLVPRSGSVRLAGTETVRMRTDRLVRLGVGYAPEDRGVFAALTVGQNLRLAERGSNPNYEAVYELFPELARRSGQQAGTLSGGQQQMLAIGRTLLNDNRLLLVDEPTKGLAPKIVTEVAEVLHRAAERVPILLVEQNLGLVRRLATDLVVIESGQVRYAGEPAGLLNDSERVHALLGVARHAGVEL